MPLIFKPNHITIMNYGEKLKQNTLKSLRKLARWMIKLGKQ